MILYGIILPAVIAGVAWGVAWRVWNRGASPIAGGTWAGALTCALAVSVGYVGLWGWPGIPPLLAEGWLPFVAVAALLVSLLESFGLRSIRSVLWFLLMFGTVWVLSGPRHSAWKGLEIVGWCAGLSAAMLLICASLELVADHRPGASMPVCLWIWTVGIAGALASTGSLNYGLLAGMLAAIMGAGLVAAWIQPRISFARGTVTALTPLSMGLLFCGYFYSELPGTCALILASAPLTTWLGESRFVTRRRPWLGVLMRAALIALPVAVALVIALWPMLVAKPAGPENY